jgi:Carboxylesterase family
VSLIERPTACSQIPESVHGEELPYIFGVPLDGGRFHFHHKFTQPEAALSQTMMDLWTNFAKTGYVCHFFSARPTDGRLARLSTEYGSRFIFVVQQPQRAP